MIDGISKIFSGRRGLTVIVTIIIVGCILVAWLRHEYPASWLFHFPLPSQGISTTAYSSLIVPAASLLFVLSSRQHRISIIIRENTAKIYELCHDWPPCREDFATERMSNLITQNKSLFRRYVVIQAALILICCSLLWLGWDAADAFFPDTQWFTYFGKPAMFLGTALVCLEMLYAPGPLYRAMALARSQADPETFSIEKHRVDWWPIRLIYCYPIPRKFNPIAGKSDAAKASL